MSTCDFRMDFFKFVDIQDFISDDDDFISKEGLKTKLVTLLKKIKYFFQPFIKTNKTSSK